MTVWACDDLDYAKRGSSERLDHLVRVVLANVLPVGADVVADVEVISERVPRGPQLLVRFRLRPLSRLLDSRLPPKSLRHFHESVAKFCERVLAIGRLRHAAAIVADQDVQDRFHQHACLARQGLPIE